MAENLASKVNQTIDSASQRSFQQGISQIDKWMQHNQTYHLQNKQKVSESDNEEVSQNHQTCLPINSIDISGITLLTNKQLDKISQLDNDCISVSMVNLLIKELTQVYIDAGFITARVLAKGIDAQKKLQLIVVEGHIEAIQGDSEKHINMLFPNVLNQPLNLRQLEQGLDQANRLGTNQLTLDILPGKEFGGSIIALHNIQRRAWHFSTQLDNYGQDNTGIYQLSFNMGLDDLVGLDDYFNLSTTQSLYNPDIGLSRSYSSLYNVPYGFTSFSLFASYAEYGIKQSLVINHVWLSGNNAHLGGKFDQVLFRDANYIFHAYTQLSHKQSNNYFEHEKLLVSSFKYLALELGMTYYQQLSKGTINANIGFEKGFPQQNSSTSSLSDFNKWFFSINMSHWLTIDKLPAQIISSMYGQYSSTRLWGGEAINLSDFNVIHGLQRNNLSSETGIYWRNSLIAYYATNYGMYGLKGEVDLGGLYFKDTSINRAGAVGVTLGLTYSYQEFAVDLSLNRAWVIGPVSQQNESWRLLAQINWQF